jgi:hypothetical protein
VPDASPFVIRTGAITIIVDAPPDVLDMLTSDDLLNSCSARLHCYPRTREQFDAIVTHAGGPEAFREPDANHYVATRNGAIMLYVPLTESGRVTVLPPSLEALRAAQGRDAA